MEDDDFALLARWRADDRQAGEELCGRYFAEVHRFFGYKVEDGVDDLVQQTFIACLKGRTQFRSESSFRTYLFAIARNELYMALRASRRRRVDPEVALADEGTPSKQLGAQQELARLRDALQELPDEQRALLELHYWQDLSAPELAALFSTTAGSIRVRLLRARRMLRARLSDAATAALPAGSRTSAAGR